MVLTIDEITRRALVQVVVSFAGIRFTANSCLPSRVVTQISSKT